MPIVLTNAARSPEALFSAQKLGAPLAPELVVDSQIPMGSPRSLHAGATPPLDVLPATDSLVDAQTLASLSLVSTALGGTHLSSNASLSSLTSEPEAAGLGDTLVASTVNLYPSGAPSSSDVVQHELGDCYLDSVLAGMAATQSGRTTIQDAITTHDSTPPTYTVHMYAPNGSPIDVSVDSQMDTDGVTDAQGQMDWASIIEKAYAKYNDVYHVTGSGLGYAGIANGGTSNVVMQALTGKLATSNDLSTQSPEQIRDELAADLAGGKVVTAGTLTSAVLADGTQIVGDHAYTVQSINSDGSLTLRNPWGYNPGTRGDGSITISAQDFQQYFGTAWAG